MFLQKVLLGVVPKKEKSKQCEAQREVELQYKLQFFHEVLWSGNSPIEMILIKGKGRAFGPQYRIIIWWDRWKYFLSKYHAHFRWPLSALWVSGKHSYPILVMIILNVFLLWGLLCICIKGTDFCISHYRYKSTVIFPTPSSSSLPSFISLSIL